MKPALQGYVVAAIETATASGEAAALAEELSSVVHVIEGSDELHTTVTDPGLPMPVRRAVLNDLLSGRVRPDTRRVVLEAVTLVPATEALTGIRWAATEVRHHAEWSAGKPDPLAAITAEAEPVLGRTASRQRVNGYAAAVAEEIPSDVLVEIGNELFGVARSIEANRALRAALGDRDLPVPLRQAVVGDILAGRARPEAIGLLGYVIRGGRPRDLVGTIDALVEQLAAVRGMRVAHVQSAVEIPEAEQQGLREALEVLAGRPVELQVAIAGDLLGGVIIQLGDLRIDASTRRRLDLLRDHVLEVAPAATGPTTEARKAKDAN